jgi:hypothetical protein
VYTSETRERSGEHGEGHRPRRWSAAALRRPAAARNEWLVFSERSRPYEQYFLLRRSMDWALKPPNRHSKFQIYGFQTSQAAAKGSLTRPETPSSSSTLDASHPGGWNPTPRNPSRCHGSGSGGDPNPFDPDAKRYGHKGFRLVFPAIEPLLALIGGACSSFDSNQLFWFIFRLDPNLGGIWQLGVAMDSGLRRQRCCRRRFRRPEVKPAATVAVEVRVVAMGEGASL